ncbi:MAG: hypothetical protein KIH89_000235 [Candidatus Shapirobacteria bacterium]|nr:hypothetical protein [Candidatus Shapirobacteria bacterium]
MGIESPNFVMLDKDPVSFSEIHQGFTKTPPGQRLSQNTRWGRFQPEHVSNKEWINHLGVDANNLEHCRLTYGLAVWFINQQNQSTYPTKFNQEEQSILKLTALTHDWPEGITEKGDVNYEAKTEQDEENELSVIVSAITSIIGQSYEANELSHQVRNCLKNTSSGLGKAFNCIEAIGYLRTALLVLPKSTTTTDDRLSQQFQMLTGNVLYNSVPRLITYSEEFYPAKKFLSDRKSMITQGFSLPDTSFDGYGDQKTEKLKHFAAAKAIWQKWF